MTKSKNISRKCPRCGYEDTGSYCSQCSYPLTKGSPSISAEMYHEFVVKIFFKHRPIMRFIRTWWQACFYPGSIDLNKTYNENSKYMGDVKFISTIFFLAIGTTLIKLLFTIPDENTVSIFFFNWLHQTYFFWIFYFLLLAFIWTGRFWKRQMKMEVENERQYDSIYVYEFGVIATIVLVLSMLFGESINEELKIEEISPMMKSIGISLLIFFVGHLLWLWGRIGTQAQLPLKRLILISLLSVYLFVFMALGAEIYTLFLPFIYLGRYFYAKLRLLKKRFVHS